MFLANPDLAYANQFHLMRFTNGAFHVCLEALYKVRTTTTTTTTNHQVSLSLMRVSSRVSCVVCRVSCVRCVCVCVCDRVCVCRGVRSSDRA